MDGQKKFEEVQPACPECISALTRNTALLLNFSPCTQMRIEARSSTNYAYLNMIRAWARGGDGHLRNAQDVLPKNSAQQLTQRG